MKIFLSFILLAAGLAAYPQLSQLRVSTNRHFLINREGVPFFWLGDTGWELFHRLNKQDADAYFKKRSAQGFTVIQAVVLAELNGLHSPDANGDLPLFNDDPDKPNEAYFKYIDTLVDMAADYKLYIAMLPTWGDKVFMNKWGKGPEIFNTDNAYRYGKWIGARYKNRTNIIWVIGGDRSPRDNSPDTLIWSAMAKGIEAGTGGSTLMTFHPQPDGISSSSQWFQEDEWLNLNMLQTGHCRDTPVWEMVSSDYHKIPAKPVVNGENIYEEMPVCFNPKELGYASAYDTRKSAYLSVFAGALGHTYGCGPVIWFAEKKDNLFAAFHTWREALDLNGAKEMGYLRTLIESRPMLERIPDQSLLVNEGACAADRIQATRGRHYVFVYSSYGSPIIIKTDKILWDNYKAQWFDPRTGKTTLIGFFKGPGELTFIPPLPVSAPVPSQKEDWILILDDAAKG